jgi:hypothetical protein
LLRFVVFGTSGGGDCNDKQSRGDAVIVSHISSSLPAALLRSSV